MNLFNIFFSSFFNFLSSFVFSFWAFERIIMNVKSFEWLKLKSHWIVLWIGLQFEIPHSKLFLKCIKHATRHDITTYCQFIRILSFFLFVPYRFPYFYPFIIRKIQQQIFSICLIYCLKNGTKFPPFGGICLPCFVQVFLHFDSFGLFIIRKGLNVRSCSMNKGTSLQLYNYEARNGKGITGPEEE